MFVFKPTEKTFSDPASATFVPGIPFGREYSKGDICFLHEELQGSKMFFNSNILREAILDSKDFLEEILEIKISDNKKAEVKKEVKVEEPKKEEPVVKEVKEEETVVESTEPEPTFEEETKEVTEEPTVSFEEELIVEEVKEEPKKSNIKK